MGNEEDSPKNTVFDENESTSTAPNHSNDDLPEKDQEFQGDSPQARTLGPEDEITWHYLTFDTPIPQPARIDKFHSLPPPPDLQKFTSPFHWPRSRKLLMTWLGCLATLLTAYNAGAYAPGIPQMTSLWHVSQPAAETGITVFTIGFGVAPMFLAPFSEINGRRPVFVATGCLFVVFQLVCATTPTFAGMLVARFLAGCASSTFSTMVGGVLADFYEARDRNWAMACFAGGAICGTGIGPVVSGFIAQYTTWRWIFRVQTISDALLMILILVFFKESRGSIVLSRKAKHLNKYYDELEAAGCYGMLLSDDFSGKTPHASSRIVQRIRWKVQADEERASILNMISASLYRPFHLLFTEPVVFFFSLWITFAWSCLYLLFSTIPLIFSTRYNFTISQSGCVFAAISVGAIFSTLISIYQEPFARDYLPKRYQKFFATPEGRLFFCCIQSALLPIGCFWYGWTNYPSIPWIVPTLGIGCATMGIFSIYLAVFNYLADIYGPFASSALAAQSFCRNMAAGAFPVFVDQMYTNMGYPEASSLLGGVAAGLTIVPWVLVFYGPRIRKRSKIASSMVKEPE